MQQRMVGLALGGGFLRGAAHIGVLKVLLKEKIPVHAVAGSSAGSIVAAMFAAGHSPQQMEEMVLKVRPGDVLDREGSVLHLLLAYGLQKLFGYLHLPVPFRSPLGLMKGRNLLRTLKHLVGINTRFNDLRVCLIITAVDVATGTMVLFMPSSGGMRQVQPLTIIPPEDTVVMNDVPVAEAIRASCSVPGLYEPPEVKDRLLIDGGVRDNVPAAVLRKVGVDKVLAVDVGYDGEVSHEVNSVAKVLTQSLDIMASESIRLKLDEHADVVIRPELKNMSPWDFNKIDYCIKQGEMQARRMLPTIRKILADM